MFTLPKGMVMTRCDYNAKVVIDDEPDECNIEEIQCANEKNHNGDHLIIVPKSNYQG